MERAGWGRQSPQKLEAHPHPGQKRDRRADEDLATKQGTGAVVRKETGPRSSRQIHLRCRGLRGWGSYCGRELYGEPVVRRLDRGLRSRQRAVEGLCELLAHLLSPGVSWQRRLLKLRAQPSWRTCSALRQAADGPAVRVHPSLPTPHGVTTSFVLLSL